MELDSAMGKYFESLEQELKRAYGLAEKARAQGKDPEPRVDIPIAEDLAARVEGLVATIFPSLMNSGLKESIRNFEKEYGKNDERVALKIAEQVALQKFFPFETKEQALEAGIRVGTAYLTLGVVTAPLEGISSVKIKDNYIAIYYAGPIRSAGGTAEAMSVLIADYLRKKCGIGEFKANRIEIKRYITEVNDYNRLQNLQYLPSEEEIAMIVENTPICLDGDPTEQQEVSTCKDLARVETNRIRGGMCLVLGEGLAAKAAKVLKKMRGIWKEFDLENWRWLEELIKIQKQRHGSKKMEMEKTIDGHPIYIPSTKYVEKVIAGRPVFAHPGRAGGFRLCYGRSRTGGLAATSIHPSTMIITEFAAIGTQIATELPGKATVCTPCDTIEGPVVKLKNGDVVELNDIEQAKQLKSQIEKILSLGDTLVPFGEFLSNGHQLLPAAFTEEWWALEVKKSLKEKNFSKDISKYLVKPYIAPDFELAFEISRSLGAPLHPRYNYFWHDLSKEQLKELILWFSEAEVKEKTTLNADWRKDLLETICAPHSFREGKIILDGSIPLYKILGSPTKENEENLLKIVDSSETTTQAISSLSGVIIREKGPIRVGMKMGRPEKAERRLMKGRPQILFPCGNQGGRMRNLMQAYGKVNVLAEWPIYRCVKCGEGNFPYCFSCGSATTFVGIKKMAVNVKELLDQAFKRLGIEQRPELVKGVRGVTSKNRNIEALEKGLLRAEYDLYVNKDGTTRYDATNAGLTHFKPSEIGTSIEKLRDLGYTQDIHGNELNDKEQLLELKPQDIIISDNEDFSAAVYFIRIAKFVDAILQKFYSLEPFYNIQNKDDLIGCLVIGLAPHTSAGIIGRIIGFTPAKVCYAHPFWHAGKRRNLDGDEDSIMLLMDALLNFSRQFLPDTRGGRTMDAPLVLTSRLNPEEVDNEVWNVDIEQEYPLEFYYDTLKYKYPWEITKKIMVVGDVITTAKVWHISFTHDTTSINEGPTKTKYVKLKAMEEKVDAQLDLAKKIRAVDADRVAESILEKHFLRDIKGNLRTFSSQQVRCTECNAKYRRIPLNGKCFECGGNLLLTVSEGTVRKYLEPSKRIMERHKISTYLIQQFSILEKDVDATFGKKARQLSLAKF